MSRVRFADDTLEAPADFGKKRKIEVDDDEEKFNSNPIKKHTLDSDEEDDDREKHEKLDVRKVEGQEEATEEYDGKIKLMAFNMKEDMEEGHFDKDGNFIYDKKEDIIKDAWLDNINWENNNEEADEDFDELNKVDLKSVYNRLLQLIRENESIAKALKRLNSEKGLSAAEERKRRWAAKKAGGNIEDESSKIVSEVTALADSLISNGHMEAYQLDHNKIKELLQEMEPKIDMFADEEPSTSHCIF